MLPSKGSVGRPAGSLPVASKTCFASRVLLAPSAAPLTATLPGPSRRATPWTNVTRFFLKR